MKVKNNAKRVIFLGSDYALVPTMETEISDVWAKDADVMRMLGNGELIEIKPQPKPAADQDKKKE